MRDISKWAVVRALGGLVPNRRYSYTKDNTCVKHSDRTYRQFEPNIIPWENRYYATSSWRPSRSISTNEVWLFNNKILWYTAIDGRLCHVFPQVYWTLAGHDTVTTRERLNAFGIRLVRKRGKTFWHKPNGEIIEVDPNAEYSIHGKYVISHVVSQGIMSSNYLDYIQVIRNKRRRLK